MRNSAWYLAWSFTYCQVFTAVLAQHRLTETDRRVVEGIFGDVHGNVPLLDNADGHVSKVHVDLPGQHGNDAGFPVIHRTSVTDAGFGHDTRIDMHGEHGNQSPHPVVHRTSGRLVGHGGKTHVDLPGEHGNLSPHPVVHRTSTGLTDHGVSTHVDLPGQHGNLSPHPVVHRKSSGPVDHGLQTHADIPGQHGNQSPHPVIHRTVDQAHLPGKTHVDLPGEHGNNSPVPVVHREHGNTLANVPDAPFPGTGTIPAAPAHVDLPGQHGNLSLVPVVHRNSGTSDVHLHHSGSPPDGQSVFGMGFIDPVSGIPIDSLGLADSSSHSGHGGTHGDLPGQHGNTELGPVVHRSSGRHTENELTYLSFRFPDATPGFPDPFSGMPPGFFMPDRSGGVFRIPPPFPPIGDPFGRPFVRPQRVGPRMFGPPPWMAAPPEVMMRGGLFRPVPVFPVSSSDRRWGGIGGILDSVVNDLEGAIFG